MRRTRRLLALITTLAAAPAVAHEHGGNAMGVVRDVSAERIVIETTDGHRVAFALTEDTRFSRGSAPVRREDVKPGERAAVHGERRGEALSALRVKLGGKETSAHVAGGG